MIIVLCDIYDCPNNNSRFMRVFFFSLIAFFSISLAAFAGDNKLIIFISNDDGQVSTDFQVELPKIREMASSMNLDVVLIDAKTGAPDEVGALPAMYLYDGTQALYYKGQYDATDRLKAFLQNANRFNFEVKNQRLESVMVSESERFTKITRLKVTDVKYEGGEGDENIEEPLKNALAQTAHFAFHDKYVVNKQSKIHYLDLYPFKAKNGVYYINTAVYSQHNCVEPLFKSATPFTGKDIVQLGQEIGAWFAKYELELYQNTQNGDGLEVIKNMPVKSWSTLGFPLKAEVDITKFPSVSFPQGTKYFQPVRNERPVVFTFSPPLSNYNGSASTVYGALVYRDKLLTGEFGVVLQSITMGDELLDESVKGHQLQTPKFPIATFKFDEEIEIKSGESFPVNGELAFMGMKKKQTAKVTMIKSQDSEDWMLDASLTLDISPFPSLERPDGQAPLNHTVYISVISALKDAPAKVVIPQPVEEGIKGTEEVEKSPGSELLVPANSYVSQSGGIAFTTEKFNVNGSSSDFKAFLAPNDVVYAEVDLNSFEFKKGATMKKHAIGEEGLHAESHPLAIFRGKIVSGFDSGKSGEQRITISGELDLHGYKIEQELTGTLVAEANQLTIKTVLPVERLKFSLNGKKASSIDEIVNVRIEMVLAK